MAQRHLSLILAAALVLAARAQAQEIPLTAPAGLRPAPCGDVSARLTANPNADAGKPAVGLDFSTAGGVRRFVGFEAKVQGDAVGVRALRLRCRLTLAAGTNPRPACVLWDRSGAACYKVGSTPLPAGEFLDAALPLAAPVPAGFSEAPAFDWSRIVRVWYGVAVEGPARGVLAVSRAVLTREPYRATQPLLVDNAWGAGCDPAVQHGISVPAEGPGGKRCMRFDFRFPGGRHMYAIPSMAVPGELLEGYSALRFSYRATVPAGINGLLVMLGERGAQFFLDPPAPASAEWTTLTVPFDKLKPAPWSKDDNGKLDLNRVDSVMVGAHGTAAGDGGPGTIWITDVQFVP